MNNDYIYVYDGKMASYCQKSKVINQKPKNNNDKTGGGGGGGGTQKSN